jgi:sugar phosphate isomerase/epimerase
MNEQSRRDFLKLAGVGSLGAALAWPQASMAAASSAASTNRPLRLALKGVTYTGVWYNGAALSIPAIIDRAKKFGYDGIEIDAKRPQAFPLDVSRKDREAIRRKLDESGMKLAAVAAYNNFIEPLREYQEMNLALVRQQIDLARDLGAKVLRVFAAWAMIADAKDGFGSMDLTKKWLSERLAHLSLEQRRGLAIRALKELAPFAADAGVTLAVQNHPPGVDGYKDVLAIVDGVGSPAVKACVDLQNLQPADDVRQAVLDTGARQVHVHVNGEFRRNAAGRLECYYANADFTTYLKALLEIGYQGFVSFEFCHRCLRRDAQGNKLSDELAGIERIDEQVQLARDFLEQTMADAKRQLVAKN